MSLKEIRPKKLIRIEQFLFFFEQSLFYRKDNHLGIHLSPWLESRVLILLPQRQNRTGLTILTKLNAKKSFNDNSPVKCDKLRLLFSVQFKNYLLLILTSKDILWKNITLSLLQGPFELN